MQRVLLSLLLWLALFGCDQIGDKADPGGKAPEPAGLGDTSQAPAHAPEPPEPAEPPEPVDPGAVPITAKDLDGLIFLSPGECPSGPGWAPFEGYTGRFIAVDDSVTGVPSKRNAHPDDLVINLRGPCQGKGRLGVADAPNSTQTPTGGTLCDTSLKKGRHTHDRVGFRLCIFSQGAEPEATQESTTR